MKKSILFLIFLFLFFTCCGENNNSEIINNNTDFDQDLSIIDAETESDFNLTRRGAPELDTQFIVGYESITIFVIFSYEVLDCEVEFNGEILKLNNSTCILENLDFNTKYDFVLKIEYFDNIENQIERVNLSATTLDLDIDFSNAIIDVKYNSAIVNLNIDEKYIGYIDEINVLNYDKEKIDIVPVLDGQVFLLDGLEEDTDYVLEIIYKSNEIIYIDFKTLNQFVEMFEYEMVNEYYYLNAEDYGDLSKRVIIPCIKVLKLKQSDTKNLVIPNEATIDGITYPITRLGLRFCCNNQYLETVSLSVNLKKLDSQAFLNCINLKTVKYNDGDVTFGINGLCAIFNSVFQGCTSLETVDLKCNDLTAVLHIENSAFFGCDKLKTLRLSSNEKSYIYIQEGTFDTCTSLTEIDSPEIIYCDPLQPFPDQIDPIYNDPNKYYS